MSHYAVAVFHKADQEISDLLAPYDENMAVEPYISMSRQEAIDYAREHYKGYDQKSDEECWQCMADDAGEGMTDEAGNIYSTYNPKSKWDWWYEGGRWGGMLNRNGESVDSGRFGDLSFPLDEEAYKDALRFWDSYVDHKPDPEGKRHTSIFKEEYYLEYYGDRETYARQQASFSTYAVVTPDGEWHAPGDMGWFGCSSESGDESRDWYDHYKERFLDTADPDWILTIVDCHI